MTKCNLQSKDLRPSNFPGHKIPHEFLSHPRYTGMWWSAMTTASLEESFRLGCWATHHHWHINNLCFHEQLNKPTLLIILHSQSSHVPVVRRTGNTTIYLNQGQMAERLGNRALNLKVAGSVPVLNDVVSLGEALHPTCLGGNVPVLTVSRSG